MSYEYSPDFLDLNKPPVGRVSSDGLLPSVDDLGRELEGYLTSIKDGFDGDEGISVGSPVTSASSPVYSGGGEASPAYSAYSGTSPAHLPTDDSWMTSTSAEIGAGLSHPPVLPVCSFPAVCSRAL